MSILDSVAPDHVPAHNTARYRFHSEGAGHCYAEAVRVFDVKPKVRFRVVGRDGDGKIDNVRGYEAQAMFFALASAKFMRSLQATPPKP